MARRNTRRGAKSSNHSGIIRACMQALEGRTYFGGGRGDKDAEIPIPPPAPCGCEIETKDPIYYVNGIPKVVSSDLSSNVFGMKWGLTRTWTGANYSGASGNGWAINELPYLNILTINVSSHAPILQVNLPTSGMIQFDGNTGETSWTAHGTSRAKLRYIPASGTTTKVPGMFQLTEEDGSVWMFYDVARNQDPGDNPIHDTANTAHYGAVTTEFGYSQQPTNQWFDTSDSSTPYENTATAKYRYGAFSSYTDASGRVQVAATYDADALLTDVTRTDATGAFEKYHYNYTTLSYTPPGQSAVSVKKILNVSMASSGPSGGGVLNTPRVVEYEYYNPGDADTDDDADGRLGDLKLVTISQPDLSTPLIISSLNHSGKTVVATITAHSFADGDLITIPDGTYAAYTGTFVVASHTTNTVTFEAYSTPAGNINYNRIAYKHDTIDHKYYRYHKFYTASYGEGQSWSTDPVNGVYNSVASVSSLSRSGTLATAVTSSPHGYVEDQWVNIAGASPSGFNGWYQVSNVVNSTTFQYVMPTDPGAFTSGTVTSTTKHDKAGGTDTTFRWQYNPGTPPEDNVVMSGLKSVVEGANFDRMAGNYIDYETLPDVDLDMDTITGSDDNSDGNYFNDDVRTYGNNLFHYERYLDNEAIGDTDVQIGARFRIVEETAAGAGCSSCAGGLGTTKLEFTENSSSLRHVYTSTLDANIWKMKTKEYLPDITPLTWDDNSYNLLYTNDVGAVMLKVEVDTQGTTSTGDDVFVPTYYRYDSAGRQTYIVHSSALRAYSSSWDANNDLVVWYEGSNLADKIYAKKGLIEKYTYPTSTTATTSTDGDVVGYVKSYSVHKGLRDVAGTIIYTQQYRRYGLAKTLATGGLTGTTALGVTTATVAWANSGFMVGDHISVAGASPSNYVGEFTIKSVDGSGFTYDLLSSTATTTATGTIIVTNYDRGGVTKLVNRKDYSDPNTFALTSYAYTWATNASDSSLFTSRVASMTVTHPEVTDDFNGPNGTTSSVTVYDSIGRPTWMKDEAGFIRYYEYDVAGGMKKTIVDVDTSLTYDFAGKPSGWDTPTGGGLHLKTLRGIDALGRTHSITDPAGNITHTVYLDAKHEWRRYAGWDGYSLTAAPIEIHREYRPAAGAGAAASRIYSEVIASTAKPAFVSSVLTGGETIDSSNIVSLSRSLTNDVGQVVERDEYFSLSGITYSTTSARLGTESNDSSTGNFLATYIDYDGHGRVKRTQSPSGMITRTVYDGRDRAVSSWVGTDDTPVTTDTYWSPENTAGTNLLKVSETEYDNGFGGDGLVTKTTQYTGGTDTAQVTRMAYDWRNRLLLVKEGAQATESTSGQRSLTAYTYDDQGRVIATEVYDGDQVGVLGDALVSEGFLNPSFENTVLTGPYLVLQELIDGWLGSTLTTDGDYAEYGPSIQPDGAPGHGDQHLLLAQQAVGTAVTVSQTVNNMPAGTYRLSFKAAWDNVAATVPVLRLKMDNVTVHDFTLTSPSYTSYSTDFSVSRGDHVFKIETYGYDMYDARNISLDIIQVRQLSSIYDSDGDGAINMPSGSLRSRTTSIYDEMGRVATSEVYKVSTSGTYGSSDHIDTNYWYDSRGNVIKTTSPGGLVQKTVYDGAGRTVATYQSDGGGDSVYGNADDVVGDKVLTQTKFRYDKNGNVLFTETSERAHSYSGTGELPGRSKVVGRQLFYNNSVLDGNDSAPGSADDEAISGKSALLPGGTATISNLSSYLRGINGVMIDVHNLTSSSLSGSDFSFKVGNDNSPGGWSSAPSPASITVREGAGIDGSDRIEVIWADGAITNEWLQVTLNANANTGLVDPDVFYFGNQLGDADGDLSVDNDDFMKFSGSKSLTAYSDMDSVVYSDSFDVYVGNSHTFSVTGTANETWYLLGYNQDFEYYYSDLWYAPSGGVPMPESDLDATDVSSYVDGNGWAHLRTSAGANTYPSIDASVDGILTGQSVAGGFADADFDLDGILSIDEFNSVLDNDSSYINMISPPSASAPSDVPARTSYTESYFDAVNRPTDSVNLGTNGDIAKISRDTSAPTRSDSALRTSFIYQSNVLQGIQILGSPSGGTFTLTFNGQTTSSLSYNASASDVQSALVALSNINPGDAIVYNGGSSNTFIVWMPNPSWVSGTITATSSLTGGTSPKIGFSRPTMTIDPKGKMSVSDTDLLGRTTRTIANLVDGLPSATDDQVTDYTYDGNGQVLTMTARLPSNAFQTTQYIYGFDQTDSTRTLTSLTRSGSDATATLTSHGYAVGQQITISGASQPEYNGTFLITDVPSSSTFKFTVVGTPATTATGTILVSLSGLHSEDMLSAVRYPDKSTGAASGSEEETFTLNALGQRKTYTDRNGSVHTYTYDDVGRMTIDAITTPGSGVDVAVLRIEYGYNTYGWLEKITTYNAASGGSVVNDIKREYNGLGQLTKEYQDHAGLVGGSEPYVEYAYSEMSGGNHSRLVSMKYPSGRVIDYVYDSGLDSNISRLSSIVEHTGGAHLEDYTYVGLGTVVKRAHPISGSSIDQTLIRESGEGFGPAGDQYIGLDTFGRIADHRWIKSGTDLDRYQYSYDRNGNVLSKTNTVSSSNSETYGYDDLNRLSGFDRGTIASGTIGSPSRSLDWNLDATGNWDSIGGGLSQDRTHNAQNQITGGVGTTPAYDDNGNMTTDQGGNTLVYDAWNRLISSNQGSDVAYTYDGTGRRITSTTSGTTTSYYFSDQWQVLEEKVSGTTRTQYVWSPVYVNAMVLRDRDSNSNGDLEERIYPTHDANYNITGLVSDAGTVLQRFVYDPYGAKTVLAANWSGTSDAYAFLHGFQGGKADGVTGRINFQRRDYDVNLGRWIQQDPMGYVDGANLYQSLMSSPLGFRDPFGEESESGKTLKKDAIKKGLELLKGTGVGWVERLASMLTGLKEFESAFKNAYKMDMALKDIWTIVSTPDSPVRRKVWSAVTKEIGQEGVKQVIGLAAKAAGSSLGGLYAAVALDAIEFGSAIGVSLATSTLDIFKQQVVNNAGTDPNLKPGTMTWYSEQSASGCGLWVFKDHENQGLWVRVPEVQTVWESFTSPVEYVWEKYDLM